MNRPQAPDRGAPSFDDAVDISIIVPSYNAERTIDANLAAIFRQETARSYEVIVIDSSADRTAERIARDYPQAKLIRKPRRTLAGAARNEGVRASRGRYLVMIDADCVAAPDAVERLVGRQEQGGYAAVGGSIGNGTPDSLSGTVGYLIEFREFIPTTPARIEKGIPTAIISYRREVFDRYGYFDEDLTSAEDLLYNWRLHQAGEQLLFDPQIRATHLNRSTWREMLMHQIRLGEASALARRRSDLPGRVLIDYPVLILLMPILRTARACRWFARHDKKLFALFLLIWPFYLLAAAVWSYGFFRGVKE